MRPVLVVMMMAVVAPPLPAQYEMAPPQNLVEAVEDCDYAELLSAGEFTRDQVVNVHRMQLMLQMDTQLTPEVAEAFDALRAAILTGVSREEAMQSLEPQQQQLVQQTQQQYQQALEGHSQELLGALSDEQRARLAWLNSPARALEGAVRGVSQARQAPDEQWAQFRSQATRAIAQLVSQIDPGGAGSPETIGALLDGVRAMGDEQFEAKRETLAREWAQELIPNRVKQLEDPQVQQQLARDACRRLISYPRGHMVVQARLDAMDEG